MLIGWFGPGVVKFGFTVPGMQTSFIPFGILVPRIIYKFLDLILVPGFYFVNFTQVAVQDDSPWHLEAIGIIISVCREITESQVIRQSSPYGSPVFIE